MGRETEQAKPHIPLGGLPARNGCVYRNWYRSHSRFHVVLSGAPSLSIAASPRDSLMWNCRSKLALHASRN